MTDAPNPETVDTTAYMHDPERRQRQTSGSERETLSAFLEFERDTVLWKLSGLSEEQLRIRRTPSGMSLLGLVKHLAYVERSWFQRRFLGRDVYIPWRGGDADGDFRIDDGETPASVLSFYLAEIEESRRITSVTESLDALALDADPPRSLRWILIHMIEETARHAGHADLMREMVDGQTGE
jgi:uncharacterized damage-inducible protein DinB